MVDFTEPVSARLCYDEFNEDLTPTYATADAAYEAWCAALGVGTLDTEYTVSAAYDEPDFIELDFEPVDGSISRWITIAQGGGLGLYERDPTVFTGAVSFNPAGTTFQYFFLPDSVPFLLVGAQSTDTGDFHQHYDLKLHKTATECIMIYTNSKEGASSVNSIRNAFRITPGFIEFYATKGVAFEAGINAAFRYAIFSYLTNAYTTSANVNSNFTGTINFVSLDLGELRAHAREFAAMSPAVSAGWDANGLLTDTASVSPTVGPAYGLALAETVGTDPAASYTWRPGAVVAEVVSQLDAISPNGNYGITLADAAQITDLLTAAYPTTITQGVGLAPAADAVRALLVLEGLGVTTALTASATYGFVLMQTLATSDSLSNFFGGQISETIGLSPAAGLLRTASGTAAEGVGLADVGTPQMVLRVELEDDFDVELTQVVSAILSPTLAEGLQVTAAYIAPDGGFTAWAVNTRTGAVTEYSNYVFNSFSKLNNRYLAASSSGLYELTGSTDDGDDVIAQIKSGLIQFNATKFAGLAGAYLGVRGEGDMFLKMVTGSGLEFIYRVRTQDMRTTKVNFGKGLRARYFSFELISTGQDFDIDTVEFVPISGGPKRRV